MHEHGPTKPVEGRLGDVDSLFAAQMPVDHALQNPAPKERPSPEKQLHGVAGVPVAVEFVGQEPCHQPQRQRASMGLGPALSQHAAQQGRRGDPDEQDERRELVGTQLQPSTQLMPSLRERIALTEGPLQSLEEGGMGLAGGGRSARCGRAPRVLGGLRRLLCPAGLHRRGGGAMQRRSSRQSHEFGRGVVGLALANTSESAQTRRDII